MILHCTKSQLLREFLSEAGISRKLVKAIKAEGQILVNHQEQTVRCQLNTGDIVELVMPEEKCDITPVAIPLAIIFEDEYYLVIDKQPGLACLPTKRHYDLSLANGLADYYQQHGIKSTIHLVNRLDKDTQGLLLVAKDRFSHYSLSTDIKQVKRTYHALVEGILSEAAIIDAPIFQDGDQMRRIIDPRGKPARTKVRPIRHTDNSTLVACELETGRTHQIRVHLKSIGHPLVNDELYNSNCNGTMYLRSIALEFTHPYSGEVIKLVKTENPEYQKDKQKDDH